MGPEPEPEPIDLSALDPSRDRSRWDRMIAQVADRSVEAARIWRTVVRRGTVGVVVAAAAALALWWSAPRNKPAPTAPDQAMASLDWALRDLGPDELLGIEAAGGRDAR